LPPLLFDLLRPWRLLAFCNEAMAADAVLLSSSPPGRPNDCNSDAEQGQRSSYLYREISEKTPVGSVEQHDIAEPTATSCYLLLPACLPVCLSVCLSVCLPACPSHESGVGTRTLISSCTGSTTLFDLGDCR
jgi:hypothetical protein